ncbi:hypothetical protein FACS1894159_11110 [Bacteroidia bacterium]|nr:hypothetical protein FACS1894159_11110 [Bacteroidia bacterium]
MKRLIVLLLLAPALSARAALFISADSLPSPTAPLVAATISADSVARTLDDLERRGPDSLYCNRYTGRPFSGVIDGRSDEGSPIRITLIEGVAEGPLTGYYDPERTVVRWRCAFHKGKREGDYTAFHRSGKVDFTATMRHDKMVGKRRCYYEEGGLKHIHTYREGNETRRVEYDARGGISLAASLKDGKKEGAVQIYKEGKLTEKRHYRADKLDGLSQSYHPSGRLKSRGDYRGGKKEGRWRYYSEKGKLLRMETYSEDKTVRQ